MALFYIDFGKLSNTISKYETILEQLDIFVDSLTATIAEIDEDVYEGMDATLVRDEWNTCATVDVPNAINQLTEIKNALVDSRKEFKECKQCCVEFADTFGISTSLIHLTGMQGVLKCDFDGLVSAGDYCYDIIEETSDIVSDANVVKEMFSSFKGGSQDDLFELVEAIYVEANNIYNTIDAHKVELNTYGGKVKAADDNLNNRLKDILSVDPKYFNKLSYGMPDYLFDVGLMGNNISTRSPEYIFCIKALEKGNIDPNKLDEYNTCLTKILDSDEAEDFMIYMEKKCYKIDKEDWNILLSNTLLATGECVRNYGDPDLIESYEELGFYLMDEVGIQINPLAGIGERVGLTNPDFIKVTDSNGNVYYGGNQGWFVGTDINPKGCGLIAFNNVMLSLSGISSVSQENYMKIVQDWRDNNIIMEFDFNIIKVGMDPYLMATYVESWSMIEGENIMSADWLTYSSCDEYDTANTLYPKPSLELMQEMLNNDIPVVMSYHSQNGEVLYSYSDMAAKKIVPGGFSSHYYTVTGIIYNVEKDGQYTTVLEISNWGEKQYIDYLEYEEQIGKGFDFQNNSMKDIVFNEFGNGILYMRKM